MNIADISHIVDGFKSRTLPKEEWTHEAHLITAASLLVDFGLEKAEALMPEMIRKYNIACGGINSSTEGYHHTITIFYLRVIDTFRAENASDDIVELVAKLLNSPIAAPYLPLQYYSKQLLFSPDARLNFVSPDLRQF